MKWNMSQKYIAPWSLHPEKRTPKTVKKKRYKIDLDFDVIYTKHMLIIYLKIIYYLFSTKHNFVHDPLKTKQCRVFRFENMDDVGKPTGCSSFWGEIFFGLFTIYKQTKIHSVCIWYSWNAYDGICSIAENLNLLGQKSIYVEHVHKNPAKAAGSRHLRFKSQHSYYGFHEACKVLCICFN